jgi:hypothetical protein
MYIVMNDYIQTSWTSLTTFIQYIHTVDIYEYIQY